MDKASKSLNFNKLLYFFVLFLLVLAGPWACTGLGVSTGGGGGIGSMLAPLNQANGEKNTGTDGNLGNDSGNGDDSGPSDPSASGSPDQPGQEGMGKPHPPGDQEGVPTSGGTIAANPSPAQPSEEGIGKCGLLKYTVTGKVRPPDFSNAECVTFTTAPVITLLAKDPRDLQWKPQTQNVGPVSMDACGNFQTAISFICVDPYPIKIKAIFGYQGVMYETVSEEISFPPNLHPPGQVVPPDAPVLDVPPEEDDPIDRYPRNRLPRWDEGLPSGTYYP